MTREYILRNMKRLHSGFTLIELLVTVAIVALLASLAVPSFRTMLVKRSVLAAAETMVSDLRYARSEALKRTTTVSVCRSSDGVNCLGASGDWRNGWIVFIDANGNGAINAGDAIIRVQQELTSITSILGTAGAGAAPFFTYQVTGMARAAAQTFILTPSGNAPLNGTRVVCISNQGRPALRVEGTLSCT